MVLPQPDGPSRAKNVPAATSRLTPRTTGVSRPKPKWSDSRRSRASAFAEDLLVPDGGDVLPGGKVDIIRVVLQRPQLLLGRGINLLPEGVFLGHPPRHRRHRRGRAR